MDNFNRLSFLFGDTPRVNILYEIYRLTKDKSKIYVNNLSRNTGHSTQTVHTHIIQMEKEGLITRHLVEDSTTKYITLNEGVYRIIECCMKN